METLHPLLSHVPTSDHRFVVQEMMCLQSSSWTKEENKKFERALAVYADDTPDRWFKVAAMIPGKTISDVMRQYSKLEEDLFDIEAGLVPIPGYRSVTPCGFDQVVSPRDFDAYRKLPNGARGFDQDRRKGVPWTEEEHRRFLLGLLKYGKGDWRNISRNFVGSKTPTQVASHAQKYYQRQLSGAKDKRRPSIHDITTVNLLNANLSRPSSDHGCLVSKQAEPKLGFTDRDNAEEGVMFLGQNLSSVFSSYDPAIKFSGKSSRERERERMSYLLPHLHSGWAVDQSILAEEERLVVIRFGHDWDETCMQMDEVLASVAETIKNFAVIYLVDITEVPDFNTMYELYDPSTVMFFFRNKHIMIDLGTGNNNKINWALKDKQEFIDIIETVYRGARKGRGLVIAPKDYSTKYRY